MTNPVRHIAFIMDGNGRWAKKRLLPRSVGHVRGVAAVRQVVQACAEVGVTHVTLFAFSTENWRRPSDEVSKLMELFLQYLQKELLDMQKTGIRLRVIGDRQRLGADICLWIDKVEQATRQNQRLQLTVAANYGGQWDIVQATQRWHLAHPHLSLSELTPDSLAAHLSTADMPAPDLLIRTGGEARISNFMLWQIAYTELYFTDVLWPDFNGVHLQQALGWYAQRVRRFGRTDEQVAAPDNAQL